MSHKIWWSCPEAFRVRAREIKTSVLIVSWLVLTSCSRSPLYNPAGVLCLFWRLHGSPGLYPGYPRSVRTVCRVPNLVSSFQQDPLARAVPLVVVVDLVITWDRAGWVFPTSDLVSSAVLLDLLSYQAVSSGLGVQGIVDLLLVKVDLWGFEFSVFFQEVEHRTGELVLQRD